MTEGGNSVTVDIESMTTSIENMMGDNLYMPPQCCIFRTPAILLRQNEKAYVPDAFSIGPFHHAKENLTATEKIKLKYLHGLIHRAASPEGQLRELIKAITEIEGNARKCYAESFNFSVEELVKILVLDGCFIIELFRKDANVVQKDPDDPIFNMSCLLQFLNHDLILLENQIPWFVLELLFNKTKVNSNSMPLDQLAIKFFNNMFQSYPPSMESLHKTKFPGHKSNHILDLLRNLLILSSEEQQSNPTSGYGNQNLGWQPFPTATTLKEAGIQFVKVASNSILDVKFRNGYLEIPSLLIQETTETIFRNLISFEQCMPTYSPRITSYAKLMVNLIHTSKDMEILCKKSIVDNWLNVEEATRLVSKLYNGAYMKEFHYHKLCNQVNRFCKLSCPKWQYNLRHNYFNTPWATVVVIFGGLILLFTFILAVCSVIQTAKPNSSSDNSQNPLCILYQKDC